MKTITKQEALNKIEELKGYIEGLNNKVLTLEEAKEKGYFVYSFDNDDYIYKDETDIHHLIRDGKELCKGNFVYSYSNGDYKYEDENGIHHLIRDGKELCKGYYVYSYENGDYDYEDEDGIHYCKIIDGCVWERKEKW